MIFSFTEGYWLGAGKDVGEEEETLTPLCLNSLNIFKVELFILFLFVAITIFKINSLFNSI